MPEDPTYIQDPAELLEEAEEREDELAEKAGEDE